MFSAYNGTSKYITSPNGKATVSISDLIHIYRAILRNWSNNEEELGADDSLAVCAVSTAKIIMSYAFIDGSVLRVMHTIIRLYWQRKLTSPSCFILIPFQ